MNSSTIPTARPGKRTSASTKRPERFGLAGPSIKLDPRTHAVRGDVADIALAGVLFAPHYAQPLPQSCILPLAPIRERASEDAALTSQILYGETFHVLDQSGGWAWGYSASDHYVGYVPADALAAARTGEWRVAAPETVSSLGTALYMGSPIDGTPDGDQLETPHGAIDLSSLIAADARLDPVEVAQRFLDAPYLLGGRSAKGIDCSGLVQLSYAMAGVALPRDSDLQAAALEGEIAPGDRRAGDLAFFPGHVGMMLDNERMIHATAFTGKVVIEPLADVEARSETARVARP